MNSTSLEDQMIIFDLYRKHYIPKFCVSIREGGDYYIFCRNRDCYECKVLDACKDIRKNDVLRPAIHTSVVNKFKEANPEHFI